jgi:NADH-quinone oxidoreductase subunit G/[NiFe] hydrogenase diaphorase moiety small subunit/NADP-reducing hydrogenase subunit HndD
MLYIKINDKNYQAEKGQTVLEVCRENKIFVPTLCQHDDLGPSEGVCRMCLVKTNKHRGLVTSCQTEAEEGLEVVTEDFDIERARRYNLELLWTDHFGKCGSCVSNGNCELQRLAGKLEIDVDDFVPTRQGFTMSEQLKILKESLKNRVVDDKNPSIMRDNQYCIECRRCIKTCQLIQTVDAYGNNYRNIKTNVGTPSEIPLDCIYCGQCVTHCPTAAIVEKSNIKELNEVLLNSDKIKIFQIAPSVRFTAGEAFGLEPGTLVEGKIITALRKMGADLVFDTTFSADLTIVEEANELIEKIKKKIKGEKVAFPMFTSCCPSWVLYIEKYYPELIPNLSSCRSPQGMLGSIVKTHYAETKKIMPENIVNISVMPCTSKKYEAQRPELGRGGRQDTDIVITANEFAKMVKQRGIDFVDLKEGKFDKALGKSSGAGIIFGSTGGVMEAALRTAYEQITCDELGALDFKEVRGAKGIKTTEITIPKSRCLAKEMKIKVAVAHEIRNAKKIVEMIKEGECDFDFVEVMACPSGCLGGGGQPYPVNEKIRAKRRKAIYERDKGLPIRKSHENPEVKELYEDFLQEPGGHLSEKLLHTKYFDRKKKIG